MAHNCHKVEQKINNQLTAKKIKRDVDVHELYLSEEEISDITDLSRFRNLQFLWLNNNKLRSISCLGSNLRMTELYLQHNELTSVTGSLEHLTCLQLLFLHNNQLEKLAKVVHELRNMHSLHTLNLFHNPLAQEPDYRLYVIHHVPSIKLLDRKEVLKAEIDSGNCAYNQERDAINESIAFGRRSEGPPSLHYPGGQKALPATVPAGIEVGNNFYRNFPPFASNEEAVNMRHLRRSVMEFTTFDWSGVPRSADKQQESQATKMPRTITTRFR